MLNPFLLPALAAARSKKRGVALLMVLACLVLITVLILAFLASISTEVQSSKFYANGSSVKLLAQSSVDMVMSEIRDATANPALCWTSQPGMVRTYDNTGQNTGTHTHYYKLYSDGDMTGAGVFDPTTIGATGNAVPTHWYNQQGVYVDLNQPLSVGGTNRYPILDGDSTDLATMTGTTGVAGFSLTSAPVDPSSASKAPMPVKWLYVLKNGQVIAPSYVADSNSVTTTVNFPSTDPVTGNTLTTPTASNPIVGRLAFWTDDETCKVNINTASEAANPWDVPRLNTTYDQQTMSYNQPVQHEFQRYPGHPATVCLSTVLGHWLPVPATGTSSITTANYSSQLLPYYNLVPKIVAGTGEQVSATVATTTSAGSSSKGGTTLPTNSSSTSGANITAALTSGALIPDVDRLYDSIDELVFAPNRQPSNAAITQQALEEAKFFLTTHSRAPDVNLFNQPRVSMWPVSSRSAVMPDRSPADQLIASCTQVGRDSSNNPYIYYFQRLDPNDQYTDLPSAGGTTGLARNRTLLEYLRYLTQQQVPGFGGSFGGASGKYNATDTVGGGVSTSGIATATTECDQILTEIFDYIRSTNTRDQSIAASPTSNALTPYTVAFNTSFGGPTGTSNNGAGTGQVLPIVDVSNGTRGFGRFPTLQQAALIFYVSGDDQTAAYKPTQLRAYFVLSFFDPSMGYSFNVPWYQVRVSGLSNFTWDGTAANPMFTSSSDPAIVANGVSTKAIYPGSGGIMAMDPMFGGTVGFRRIMYYDLNGVTTGGGATQFLSQPYPASNPSNLPLSTAAPAGLGITNIPFHGGDITVTFYKTNPSSTPAGAGTTAVVDLTKPVQTIKFNFPSAPAAGFPLPTVPSATVPTGMNTPPSSHAPTGTASAGNYYAGWESWPNRYTEFQSTTFQNADNPIVSDGDVIRAVTPNPGDLRLIAARQKIGTITVAANFFQPHPLFNSGLNFAHNLQSSGGAITESASAANTGGIGTGGRLVPLTYDQFITTSPTIWQNNTEYYQQNWWSPLWSDIPTISGAWLGDKTATATSGIPGDWDNGVGNLKDGPYINKADEGQFTSTSGGNNPPYYWAAFGQTGPAQTFFSPNRMMPSAGMLGSLPTGVLANNPWQTLLFRPGPSGHPGLGSPINSPVGPPYATPPDFLLMDLFTMPVVEPYAISEPLSTAGRINMNYQILPFTYITRNTGVQAVLKSLQILSIPDTQASKYKYNTFNATNPNGSNTYRFPLNIPATLTQFDARFANKDLFRSPAEICSIDLVPNDPGTAGGTVAPSTPTRANMDAYWATHQLTGDNSRERPYANIYPLLTTRSNSFTVHFRVQTLQPVQGPGADATKWREDTDVITGEYRGSQTIERYVDPQDTTIPDYATSPSTSPTVSLNSLYKFRVVSVKQFAP